MLVVVIRTIASVACRIVGLGLSSSARLCGPWKTRAFIVVVALILLPTGSVIVAPVSRVALNGALPYSVDLSLPSTDPRCEGTRTVQPPGVNLDGDEAVRCGRLTQRILQLPFRLDLSWAFSAHAIRKYPTRQQCSGLTKCEGFVMPSPVGVPIDMDA